MRFMPLLLSGLGLAASASIADMPEIKVTSVGRPAPRWKGRRTSKYMPHQGEREVARRRRQRLKIEAKRNYRAA